MTIDELNKLKGQRAQLVKDMRALSDKEASGPLSADDQTKYAAMEKDFDAKTEAINRAENLSARETQLRNERDSNYRADVGSSDKKRKVRDTADYKEAFFDGFIRKGPNNLGPKFHNVLTEGADADGGFLVPTELETAIVKKVYEQDIMRTLATVRTSSLDSSIPIRTGIPTFAWLGESGTYGNTGPTYGKLSMQAHKCGGIIPISDELLLDSMENMEAEINETAGLAFSVLEIAAHGTGNGVAQPLGLFSTPATLGGVTVGEVIGGTSATAAITADNLVDTFHTLAPQYRAQASWLLNDSAIKLIRKLKTGVSGDLTYLWQPGLIGGQPDTLLGKPVYAYSGAPTPAVSTRSIAFGNMRAYRIQDRLGIAVKYLNERYAELGQVGFRFTMRTDAKLTDGNAVVFFKHGAAS